VAALLAFLVVLSSLSFGVPADEVSPKPRYDGHRWLQLRDAVAKGAALLFCQGAVAGAFNDLAV
jgi:hypothetical protein